jgi:hypothetical protein
MYQALELITDSGSFSLGVLINEKGQYEMPTLTLLSNVSQTGKQEIWDNPDFLFNVFLHYLIKSELPNNKEKYGVDDSYLVKDILDNIKFGEILELREMFKQVYDNLEDTLIVSLIDKPKGE